MENETSDVLFRIISKEAWTTLLLQVVRVFVTLSCIKSNPIPQPVYKTISPGGNIYGNAEVMLLNWANHHLPNVNIIKIIENTPK
jgi:hypothetical protein